MTEIHRDILGLWAADRLADSPNGGGNGDVGDDGEDDGNNGGDGADGGDESRVAITTRTKKDFGGRR